MQIEITLVDYIIVVGALKESIVAISYIIEIEEVAHTVAGVSGGGHKVSTRFTEDYITLNNFLHALENSEI